jgi:Na+/proline symporter
VAIRLISEVFANLLVIGILFGAAGTNAYTLIILASAGVALIYSMLGGLHASLRTDVFQMTIFLITLFILIILTIGNDSIVLSTIAAKPFDISEPGPVLMIVALMQIWSYPMHDPVMMDRGFLADRDTTRKSFYHAAWISIICISLFGCLGVLAGESSLQDESMNDALLRLLGENTMLIFSITLIISALSTLDSTLSSSAKLIAIDMKLMAGTMANGRIIMLLFMLAGVLLVFSGNKDLFSAVAVSGTVSMYLIPVIVISLWGRNKNVPVWSYVTSFVIAVSGAALYFSESSGYTSLLGDYHKYTKLLMICVFVSISGLFVFLIGSTGKKSAL